MAKMIRDKCSITFYNVIHREVEKAERKFPWWPDDPIHAAAIVVEEAGELQQAALQFVYEDGTLEEMEKEALHTAAMAHRFLQYLCDYKKPLLNAPEERRREMEVGDARVAKKTKVLEDYTNAFYQANGRYPTIQGKGSWLIIEGLPHRLKQLPEFTERLSRRHFVPLDEEEKELIKNL